jgi:hypothetical protein
MTDPPNIAMPDNYLNWRSHPRKDRLWTIRFMASFAWLFRYVIAHTSAHWIYVSDDDILINFDLLPAFMRELHTKYDPLREVVVRGDCIINGPVYPQGGSGVVLSRRAIEKLAPFGHYSIWGFWEECPDQRLGRLMTKVFSGTAWYTSTAFLGVPLDAADFRRVLDQNFSRLPPCPDGSTLSQHGCLRFVAPVREIVFLHIGRAFKNGAGWLKERRAIATHLWNAPPQVSFRPSIQWRKALCWRKQQNSTRSW